MREAPQAAPASFAMAARDITVSYGKRRVLENFTFEVQAGAWTCIVGPNGCGKSTLLRALAGLLEVESGTVWLQGRPLTAWPRRARAQRIAWLAQAAGPSDLSAADCVALGRFAHVGWLGALQQADDSAVRAAMMATGSLAWAGRRLSTLSGGERQRVHLARTLAAQASVLLLDEPTTHLDPPHQQDVGRLLREQAHGCGVTIVSAIHDLSMALMADRLLVMGRTGFIGHGTAREAVQGDWLSRAFETPIKIMHSGESYVWQPHLGGTAGSTECILMSMGSVK